MQNTNKQDLIGAVVLGALFVVGMFIFFSVGGNPIDSVFEQNYDPNVKIYQESVQEAELNSITEQ
ncbi:hypothetical protein EalM132_00189 [Exiguobacterium phage vB_EalM-132]|nr:hypothetical protein EalM132_00019 [Exiguobacterium phage vB_EalM-132]AYP68701.1 hypothetical protein EalM132_00189 [Exiguobacterium phage vB_EalM-132]